MINMIKPDFEQIEEMGLFNRENYNTALLQSEFCQLYRIVYGEMPQRDLVSEWLDEDYVVGIEELSAIVDKEMRDHVCLRPCNAHTFNREILLIMLTKQVNQDVALEMMCRQHGASDLEQLEEIIGLPANYVSGVPF